MKTALDVLVSGRSQQDMSGLKEVLEQFPGVTVHQSSPGDDQLAPASTSGLRPDLLLFLVSDNWEQELAALGDRPASEKSTVVVVGNQRDAAVMRAAMRAGARDFFTYPVVPADLAEILKEVSLDKSAAGPGGASEITAVVGARGGAGTSTIASNVAHIMSRTFGIRPVLMDMDIQFGTLPLFFDLQPSDGLLEALSRVESLDEVAIEGYMLKHGSGVHILGSAPDQVVAPGELHDARLVQLVDLLKKAYQHIVIDLPRQIDNITDALTSAADRVIVVVQPNIPHIKDTKQLLKLLTGLMGVPAENIIIAANRCDANNPVSKPDLEKVFSPYRLVCLGNDFATVSESQNVGKPVYDLNPRSTLTRDLIALTEEVTGMVMPKPQRRKARGLFSFLG